VKIYIATSWKNEELAKTVAAVLRQDGHEVDCFCDPSNGRYCFRWTDYFKDIKEANVFSFLGLPAARKAFREDKKWIDWCDALVMIYPCGNSAHLEGGYAKGTGKKFYIWGAFPEGYFENMYGFADGVFGPEELPRLRKRLGVLKMTNKEYEKERDKLIPEASRYANKKAGYSRINKNEHETKEWGFVWNRAFHNKMNELAKEKGLT